MKMETKQEVAAETSALLGATLSRTLSLELGASVSPKPGGVDWVWGLIWWSCSAY